MSGSKTPVLLRQSDIDKIIKDENLTERLKPQIDEFTIGEKVEIKDGPFLGFSCTIKEINNDKITLETIVFGRPTNVSGRKEEEVNCSVGL